MGGSGVSFRPRAMVLVFHVFQFTVLEGSTFHTDPEPSDVVTFEKAYEFTGRRIVGTTYVQFNVSTARIRCSPDPALIFDAAAGDDCEWREPDGLPVNERKMIVDKRTCDLILLKPRSGQTGTYSCVLANSGGLSRHAFKRHVVVYHVPEYFLTYTARYLTFACSEIVLERLLAELRVVFCPADPTGCRFAVEREDCFKEGGQGLWTSLSFRDNSKSIASFTVVRRVDLNFEHPACELKCVKKAYVERLVDDRYKEAVAQVKANADVYRELTGLVFLPGASEEKIDGTCRPGHFVHLSTVCLPCPEGYHRPADAPGCRPCGYFGYQSKVGSASCERCPRLGFSSSPDKRSPLECTPLYLTWQGVVAATSSLLLLLLFLQTGCCDDVYRHYATVSEFKDRDERLSRETVFSPLSVAGGETESRAVKTVAGLGNQASVFETFTKVSKMPRESRLAETLTREEVDFLKEDLKNVRDLSLTYDPSSTGLSDWREKKMKRKRTMKGKRRKGEEGKVREHKFRRDDEYLPEVIRGRQHSALGWTHKYNVARFNKPYRTHLVNSSGEDDDDGHDSGDSDSEDEKDDSEDEEDYKNEKL